MILLVFILVLTYIAGIVIRWAICYLPEKLHRRWTEECRAYLNMTTSHQTEHSTSITNPFNKKIKWHYLPFSSLFLKREKRILSLILDIILFASSIIIFYHFDDYIYWASSLFFTWLLITSSAIDFEHQILPDELTYILLWTGLILSCQGFYTYPTSAILGAFIAYSALFIIAFFFKLFRKKEGIGQGDLKLFAAIATWTGFMQLPLTIFLASLFSLIFIIMRRIICGDQCSAPASFGPFLALAGWLVLLWGNEINFYLHF